MSAQDFSERDMLHVLREARKAYRFHTSSLRFRYEALNRLTDAKEVDRITFDLMPAHVSPSERWRLAIDDAIDFLINTGRAKIGTDRHFFGDQGPYIFAREFMGIFLSEFEKFGAESNERSIDLLFYLQDKLSEARANILFLTDVDWGKFIGPSRLPRPPVRPWNAGEEAQASIERKQGKAINACIDDLNRAFAATVRLCDLVGARLEMLPQHSGPGRRASEVRRAFVRHVARLYELLTGKIPSSSPESPFAAFVDSAWNSMADDVPPVSFQRTIADVCGVKNRDGSET